MNQPIEHTANVQSTSKVHAPLVDSVSCYCKGDSGLKTVAGAWKFVPGSKSKNTRKVRTRVQPPLLPGLLDDLAIACLVRVPRIEHRKLRLVCKRWNHLLSGNFFYSLRKSLGMAEEWLYVIIRDRDGKNSLHAFDPTYQLWQPLPPIPGKFSEAFEFSSAVLSGCHLYLFGGRDPVKGSMSRVIFYSAHTNKWRRAPDMLQKRHWFTSCVINNCLYVVGGECEETQRTLTSAEVYDPNRNRWSFISEMNPAMVPCTGFVHNGTWFLLGFGSGPNIMCEAYSPETDTWTLVSNGMVNAWHGPCISLNGQLYAVGCRDGCKLVVYDMTTDSWKMFIHRNLRLDYSHGLATVVLVSLNGKLCIVRNNMSISLVDISIPNKQVESNPHLWENIGGEGHLKTLVGEGHLRTLVKKLWSTIAGRRRGFESQVVCGHVLEA